MRNILTIIFICIGVNCSPAQTPPLSLQEVVNHYTLHTPSAEKERLQYENERMSYENYKKGLLPALSFDLTPISFNHSLKMLQRPEDGSYAYVEDFSNITTTGLTLSQNMKSLWIWSVPFPSK